MRKSNNEIDIGSVVYSLKGRDAGCCFAVVALIDEYTVKISDGQKHKLNSPKRKNIKHLVFTGAVLDTISQKIRQGKKVFDSEIYSALSKYTSNCKSNENEE
jgi:large subunit ribosomal protein L14e